MPSLRAVSIIDSGSCAEAEREEGRAAQKAKELFGCVISLPPQPEMGIDLARVQLRKGRTSLQLCSSGVI